MLSRRVFCLSSWFMKPEFGMQKHELLARASAFLIADPAAPTQTHVVSCAHVAYPFLYPNYYPDDWLKHVKPEDVIFKLESREASGRVAAVVPLANETRVDVELDIVALSLTRDVESLALKPEDVQTLGNFYLKENEPLTFAGHRLTQDNKQAEDQVQVPHLENGRTLFVEEFRTLASTAKTLEMGMCGGPALAMRDQKVYCAGMVTGFVSKITGPNASEQLKRFEGCAAFVPSPALIRFLSGEDHKH